MSYFFLYILVFVFAAVVMSLAGITPAQAMGLSAGCLSSAGATAQIFGLSDLMALPDWLKVFSALLMVLGRVEIFSLLLVLVMGVHHMQHRW
jgi:trk system potassium uptake protein TrkH